MNQFLKEKVIQVARGQNRHADSLATLASSMTEEVPRIIYVELIAEPCINATIGVLTVITPESCWMDPIIDFLVEDRVPNDEKEASRVRRVAARYWLLLDRKLYRRSFGGPYLLFLHPEKVSELLANLHKGVCGGHVRGCSLAH